MKKQAFSVVAVCAMMFIGLAADVFAGEIGNTVWNDHNKNGVQDAGEEGISDVRLKLYNGDETETDKTNSHGRYKFTDLEPGHYTLVVAQETLPSGCYATYDRDGNDNGKYDKYISEGDTFTHADFGYYCPQNAVSHKVSPKTGTGAVTLVIALAAAIGLGLAIYHGRSLKKLDK